MVYEKKCVECGKIIDFGGEDPGELPGNAIEFNGDLYCRECVQKFIEFGAGDVVERLDELEDQMKKVREELGFEKSL